MAPGFFCNQGSLEAWQISYDFLCSRQKLEEHDKKLKEKKIKELKIMPKNLQNSKKDKSNIERIDRNKRKRRAKIEKRRL